TGDEVKRLRKIIVPPRGGTFCIIAKIFQMRTFALIISLAFSTIIYSQLNIIPQPAEMNLGQGTQTFKTPLQIVYDEPAKRSAEFLADYLNRFYNAKSKLTPAT